MKRSTRIVLVGTALAVFTACMSTTTRAQTITPTDTSIPSPSPTASPTVTTAPIQPPNVVRLWRKSLSTMMKVRQVHAVGHATEGVGPERNSWSGDCDLPAGRMQFVDQVEVDGGSSAQSLAVIVVGKHVWARVQGADGSWTAWKSADHVEEFYYVLSFMVPQVCPQFLAKDLKTFPTPLLRLVAGITAAGSTTWHLRGQEKGKRQTYTVNAYVNQESHVWSRIAVKSVERDRAASYSTDTQYSAINEPVDIESPMAVSGGDRIAVRAPVDRQGPSDSRINRRDDLVTLARSGQRRT